MMNQKFSLNQQLRAEAEHLKKTLCVQTEDLESLLLSAPLTDRPAIRRLIQVDATLCQLELELYGLCAYCEEPIEAERLAADPCEQSCQSCAERGLDH